MVPIEYERACKDLEACQTIDEAKYFSDKADALATWAKIYKNDKAGLAAKKLKLHAFRRMGILAGELRPNSAKKNSVGQSVKAPGPRSLLLEKGVSFNNASYARQIAMLPEREFSRAMALPRPPTPSGLCRTMRREGSSSWKLIANNLMGFRAFCRRTLAGVTARNLEPSEISDARSIINECVEWLDEFEQHMPKEKPSAV